MTLRGRVEMEEGRNGRDMLVITEMPFQQNKKELVEKMAELVIEKIIVGVSEIRDESNKE